ncbi:MAG: sulfotransferase [Deltaproteobacteria bacterium]|nr:sulfotransferase [Deltaproteobacteria bacterium]MCB9787774.1 sulfotransferase [Deltaproteobacteria bacterium]
MFIPIRLLLKILRLLFSRKYFRLRLVLMTAFWSSIFLSVWLFVQLGRALDHVFFPGFKKVSVRSPVFILANPRSGTTLLHRLMSLDDERFTCLKLYQTIMPSVTLYKLVWAVAAVDRRLGGPLRWVFTGIERIFMGGWEEIHKMGFAEAEEDEAFWVLALCSPAVHMLWPFFDELKECQFVDRMPEPTRQRLMRYYQSCIQRHLYATGTDRIFLNKTVLAAGRMGSLMELFPDAKVVYLVRDPYKAIPSAVSMFETAWTQASPHLAGDSYASRAFAQLMIDYYKCYLDLARKFPGDRFVTVMYEDLVQDASKVVTRVYEALGFSLSPRFLERLDAETRRHESYKSRHRYALEDFGLDAAFVQQALPEAFEVYGFAR